MVDVTAFFAGLCGLILVVLSINVIVDRYRYRIMLGAGENSITKRKIRAQANFAEYVPLALILMGLCELQEASKPLLSMLGYVLVLGRLFHAYGLLVGETGQRVRILFRQIGTLSTFIVIVTLSIIALNL